MDIPPHLLPLLTCSSCSAPLSHSPVVVLADGRSVCGQHQVHEPRNAAYEALAQMMRFPCQFKDRGCTEVNVWDSGHDGGCGFAGSKEQVRREKEMCCVCRGNIYISPRYECERGHKICQTCMRTHSFRCQLCKAKISNEIINLCKFWTFGCNYKSNKDQTSRHEIDCDLRGYICPFSTHDCKWSGALSSMSSHLKSSHFEDTIFGEASSRAFAMKDDVWTMVAHGEVFQCYCWVGDYQVEWIAKYVGPQEKCLKFSYEVRLSRNGGDVLMVSQCHGWNNVSLEKCIVMGMDDMGKYLTRERCSFMFKILKN